MTITVLYFAMARDLVGHDAETLTLPAEVDSIDKLSRWLEQRHDGLRGRMSSIRLARNECFASASEPVTDGDVIALIPPVSGG
jgi:molybdopterin converting factor subunit 1